MRSKTKDAAWRRGPERCAACPAALEARIDLCEGELWQAILRRRSPSSSPLPLPDFRCRRERALQPVVHLCRRCRRPRPSALPLHLLLRQLDQELFELGDADGRDRAGGIDAL